MEYLRCESLGRLLGGASSETWGAECTFPGQPQELTAIAKRYFVQCMGDRPYDEPFELIIEGERYRFSLIGLGAQARTDFSSSLNLALAAESEGRVHQFEVQFRRGAVTGTMLYLSDSLPHEVTFHLRSMARQQSPRASFRRTQAAIRAARLRRQRV